jgi:hypothetical protein
LTSITIPASVTNIGEATFYECTNLTRVYFTGNAPTFSSGVFYGDPVTIYYLADTTGWGGATIFPKPVLWDPFGPSGDITLGVENSQFGFSFNGPANLAIVVEFCTDLANPVWIPIQTNAMTNASFSFSEPLQTNCPSRFYRMSQP